MARAPYIYVQSLVVIGGRIGTGGARQGNCHALEVGVDFDAVSVFSEQEAHFPTCEDLNCIVGWRQ